MLYDTAIDEPFPDGSRGARGGGEKRDSEIEINRERERARARGRDQERERERERERVSERGSKKKTL